MKKLIYNDFTSSFAELLQRYNSVTIHQINLKIWGIKMSEVKSNLAPKVMNNVLKMSLNCPFNTGI